MTTILATIALIALVMIGMAVGVIFKRAPLKGSCGGKGGQDCLCDIEGRRRECELRDTLLEVLPSGGGSARSKERSEG